MWVCFFPSFFWFFSWLLYITMFLFSRFFWLSLLLLFACIIVVEEICCFAFDLLRWFLSRIRFGRNWMIFIILHAMLHTMQFNGVCACKTIECASLSFYLRSEFMYYNFYIYSIVFKGQVCNTMEFQLFVEQLLEETNFLIAKRWLFQSWSFLKNFSKLNDFHQMYLHRQLDCKMLKCVVVFMLLFYAKDMKWAYEIYAQNMSDI